MSDAAVSAKLVPSLRMIQPMTFVTSLSYWGTRCSLDNTLLFISVAIVFATIRIFRSWLGYTLSPLVSLSTPMLLLIVPQWVTLLRLLTSRLLRLLLRLVGMGWFV